MARFKANQILPLQPEFIAFFAELPEDAWLALRQAMIDAKVPIRDIDKKVKAKREEDAPPASRSFGHRRRQFVWPVHDDGGRAFQGDEAGSSDPRLRHLSRLSDSCGDALDPGEPKAGATGWGILIRFRDGDGHERDRVR